MKIQPLALACTVLLVTMASASAQTPASAAAMITAEQRIRIRQHAVLEHRGSVPPPSGFISAVGATLPSGIAIYWMPIEAGLNQYRYTVVGDATLVVDPDTRRIVEVIAKR